MKKLVMVMVCLFAMVAFATEAPKAAEVKVVVPVKKAVVVKKTAKKAEVKKEASKAEEKKAETK